MKTVRIDNLDGEISAVSLGLADIGLKTSEKESFRLIDAYLDMGGNFLDTARVYSDWIPGEIGRSERILGDWLASTGKRHSIVLATKGAHPRLESMNIARMSGNDITGDVELSLKALRVDSIDLYYLHRDDRTRPVAEILGVLEQCVKQGKLKRYACSNWQADRMLEAHTYASDHAYQGFAANQVHWNMASAQGHALSDDTCVTFNTEMRSAFHATGMAAVAFTALAHGYFTKLDLDGEDAVAHMHPYHTEGNLRVYHKAREIALETGMTMTDIALSYILCQPFPSAAVVSCRTMEQLQQVMAASDKTLPQELLQELESVMIKQEGNT